MSPGGTTHASDLALGFQPTAALVRQRMTGGTYRRPLRPLRRAMNKSAGACSRRQSVKLPDERNGLVFVFRVFEKMSYAMVMKATQAASTSATWCRPLNEISRHPTKKGLRPLFLFLSAPRHPPLTDSSPRILMIGTALAEDARRLARPHAGSRDSRSAHSAALLEAFGSADGDRRRTASRRRQHRRARPRLQRARGGSRSAPGRDARSSGSSRGRSPARHDGRSDAYPRALLEITDPPPVLYAEGRIELLDSPAFAIVGSRNATAARARAMPRPSRAHCRMRDSRS